MKTIHSATTERVTVVAKLADDALKLFIDVERANPGPVSVDDILAALGELPKKTELDRGVLEDVAKHVSNGEKVTERRIAKGRAAETGADGKILFLVKLYTGKGELTVTDKGGGNLAEIKLFDNIKTGQIVGRVYPPKAGVDGVSALNEKIPAKGGAPVKPALDKSVLLKASENKGDEFQVLVAQVDGYLTEEAGKITVKQELVVDGDLDYHYGNLDFIGKVIVKGDVNKGFVLKAEKGIEIRGALNGASLVTSLGDITVKGLARGQKGARMLCAGTVHLHVAQELDCESQKDIFVDKQAMDCRLSTAGVLRMSGAELIGGNTFVAMGLEAAEIGNAHEVNTIVLMGSDIETTSEYQQLAVHIETHEKAIQMIELHLGPYAKNPARIQMLKDPHRAKMQQMYAKHEQLEKSKVKLLARKKEMLEKGKSSADLRVNYVKKLYPGVKLLAGELSLAITAEQAGPGSIKIFPDEQCLKICDYQAFEESADKKTKGKK